jgi:hypothetical protein
MIKIFSKKGLKNILVIVCILFLVVSINSVDAYVSVRGYFRSNGTYVRPHVRSNPNALKYDNYSWRPSQGLYNKSFFNPTKNYSSDWYTPSYITDSDYYIGKMLKVIPKVLYQLSRPFSVVCLKVNDNSKLK